MRTVHSYAGRAMFATGLVLLFYLSPLPDIGPTAIPNVTFFLFGLALAVFAFTYKRWRE